MTLTDTFIAKTIINAPKILKYPIKNIPFPIEKKILLKILIPLFKQMIEDEELDFLSDKWLKVELTDLHKCWFFSLKEGQLQMKQYHNNQDICFSAQMNTLILLAAKKVDPDTLFFRRKLLITGDTELGLALKNLIDNLELDNLPNIFTRALLHYADWIKKFDP
ncbi:SCP2 sterol-binding domain-containing protein [uncultured Shewanella sp.]|uniref:ubiquinone anaerobic biosynthesis accessory factor UbiT n=1 Tax=uncultured Shewanella sp. TaxID=173975 RepID=UPI002636CB53|nr:SCP2 sterol-binding domain-containing protein [uncultured Shewanella sp.]